jgi:large subunit ribosomal protein L23
MKNQARLMQVLIAPHVSEKALRLADRNRQFVFKVLPNANKEEVKTFVSRTVM